MNSLLNLLYAVLSRRGYKLSKLEGGLKFLMEINVPSYPEVKFISFSSAIDSKEGKYMEAVITNLYKNKETPYYHESLGYIKNTVCVFYVISEIIEEIKFLYCGAIDIKHTKKILGI